MPGAAGSGRTAGHRHRARRRRDLLLLPGSDLAEDVEVPQLCVTGAGTRRNELKGPAEAGTHTYLIVSSCADAASSSIASRSSALATRPISVSASPYSFCSIASRTPGIVFTA